MLNRLFRISLVVTGLTCIGCADQANEVHSMKPRPVTVLELEECNFARETHLTGSVTLYREEKIGFEVAGRLLAVLDRGKEVEGPAFDEGGRLVERGDEIAQLDDTRYDLQVQALQARRNSLERQLEAQRIDVGQVAQADLQAAEARLQAAENNVEAARQQVEAADAALVLARQTLDRQTRLLQGGAGSQQNFDDAKSNYDRMVAGKAQSQAGLEAKQSFLEAQRAAVATANAAIELKQAQVESTEAQIDEVQKELMQAEEDLKDCNLLAPFSGRITLIHATQGAFIEAGTPVVTLSLMDPIQVHVAVSADEDRRIQTGDRVFLYPKDPVNPDGEPAVVNGIVYEKGAVADPLTRTFRIDVMARNERRRIQQIRPETSGLPVVVDFLPVIRRYQGEEGDQFVHTRCIYREDSKTYVLRLPGVSFHRGAQRSAVGKHIPEQVEVTLGDDYFTVIKWNFRSLKHSGDLREGDFLVVEPKREHLKGLAIGRNQWLLRPGDLVPVHFSLGSAPRGTYVPVDAITIVDDKHVVFTVEDDKARLREVSVHEDFRELRRIEGDGIEPGVRVIVSGIHYVSDGQPVSIVEQETLP